ncbi:hypothetical protein J1N09_10610 [Aureitalea sp. L0-47]|uniref:hypothetical protein n=1 Tax=Aureitalea sp. L0-47 TaxID=2816962 RepID=UPI00223778FB|nr:hypothetical protein [Aureitalea sp. L0-47]MCW5520292.1 hypothetical protein [Aureitalea sp. L0-47]
MLKRLFVDSFISLLFVISGEARNLIIFIMFISAVLACKNDPSIENKTIEISVTPIENPVEGNSSLPRLFSNGDEVYMSWVEQMDSISILYSTRYDGTDWNESHLEEGGTDWFVNWADFPAYAENGGRHIFSYLKKSDSATYAYDIILNHDYVQIEGGCAVGVVKENFKLHSDTTKTEHGFVSIVPYGEQSFFVSWLDGRNTSAASHVDHDTHGPGAMTLRGAVIDPRGDVVMEAEIDHRVCDCCQTSATITENGPLVAYRDRSEEEIRDISVVRQVNNEWLKPQTIGNDNWEIAGCPVNGPSVDAYKNSVGLAWFTAARDEGEVQVVFSADNGATFGEPIRVDSGNATGRVDLTMISSSEAAVIWMEPDGDDEVIRLLKVNSEGKKGQLVTVSRTSRERASGFPQMEKVGDTLMFAWTDVSDDSSSIKTAVLSLDKL